MDKWREREDAMVNGILSGQNACGTLKCLVERGGKPLEDFLRLMMGPALRVCREEESLLREEVRRLHADNDAKRFALESVVANLPLDNPAVARAVAGALPGHPHLKAR